MASFKEKMAKAYDFALEHIGIDMLSYPVWAEYVAFLRGAEATGSYAENQKITATRKIYQRGIVTPMAGIEQFWKEYVQYEQSINAIIADKMTNDRAKEYMKARQVANEYAAVTRGLNRHAAAVPPCGSADEVRQVEGWRRFVSWEKANPLKSEDEAEVVRRIVFAYEQALLVLAHHPSMWIEYASFLEDQARAASDKSAESAAKRYLDDAAAVYERATSGLLRANVLLHLAYADFEESRNRKPRAKEIYEKLLKEPDLTDSTLVYVHLMRFIRRSEGMKGFRQVFKQSREDPRARHHVYTASALIEYYCHKDRNVATKIFELGLKNHPSEVDFILAYIEYQKTSNEENNTRVLFERVLTAPGGVPPDDERAIEIWNKFLEFEANVGDLASITKVEKRRAAAVEKASKSRTPTAWLVDRYKFLDLLPCSPSELKAMGYDAPTAASASGSGAGVNGCSGNASRAANDRPSNAASGATSGRKKLVSPDVRQMIPFKPVFPSHVVQGVPHSVRGGVFPPPPAVAQLLQLLPHPTCFRGPFVSIDDLIGIFITNDVISMNPRQALKAWKGVENGHELFETALKASVAGRNSPQVGVQGGKVKREHVDDEEDGDGDNSNSGFSAANDIYRSRKIKNAKMGV